MLYIASALPPTSVLDSKLVDNFTGPDSKSLLVARPDRVEVWDVTSTGLIQRASLDVWGNVVCLEKVDVKGSRPHILVLLSPPSARLLLLTYQSSDSSLIVTSSLSLTPPTPSLRQAEFFSSVVAHDNVALVSLWVGILSCVEMEVEKEKGSNRRRSSVAQSGVVGRDIEGKKLVFKENFNLNIREHNLLNLAFLPNALPTGPLIAFLYLSATQALQLQTRLLSTSSHSFTDVSRPIDVISPKSESLDPNLDSEFADVPFSCPAARRLIPIPTPVGADRLGLVIGDEYSVLYSISSTPTSPRIRRMSVSSGPATSPRAAAVKRSPQNEVTGSAGKRRKSSTGKSEEKWDMKPLWRVRQGFGTVLAATVLRADDHGASVLLGDDCGRLIVIGWDFVKGDSIGDSGVGSVNVQKVDFGLVSPPSSITPLSGPYIFLSSAAGDSQLLRLSTNPQSPTRKLSMSPGKSRPIPARKGKARARNDEDSGWVVEVEEGEGRVQIMERWMNLAPVKDMTVVQDDSGAVSHLVVASGASTSNSLRIIRSGVGLEETINLEGMTDVTGIWTLKSAQGQSSLLVSTSISTSLISLESEISDLHICPQLRNRASIAAGMIGDLLMVISSGGLDVWSDVVNGNKVSSWPVPQGQEVVAAQIVGEIAVLAKRGDEIAVLSIANGQITHLASMSSPGEVSSISILASPNLPSPVVAVGTWTNQILVYLLSSDSAGTGTALTLQEPYYPASLLLRSHTSPAAGSAFQLLAGTSDGSLIVYDLQLSGEGEVISNARKVSSLGVRPLILHPVHDWQGDEQIIAVGLSERMSVIFESKDRIDFSSVSKKDITAASSVQTQDGQALVLASASGLTISRVNSLKKLSVQTLDMQEKSANRLAYLPTEKLLAVGSVTRRMDSITGEILQAGSLELRDPNTLRELGSMALQAREIVTTLQPVILLGRPYLAMGTAIFYSDAEFEDAVLDNDYRVSSRGGRVLIVEPLMDREGDWELRVVTLLKTVGPVHDLRVIHGFLAVAAASKVSINRLTPGPIASLLELSSFSSTFIAQHLYVTSRSKTHPEDRLVVGDGLRSVFVLEVDEGNGQIYGDQRDMATHCVLGMQGIKDGGDGVIVADGHSNLLTFRFKETIETAASFGLHQDIASFQSGSLAPPSSAPDVIAPDLLFATSDGRLGIIGELTPPAARTMDDLQRNMDKYDHGPGGGLGGGNGGFEWKLWRKGGSELIKRDTAGFIDGDFVQRFLNTSLVSPELSQKILEGSNTHEHINKVDSTGNVVKADKGDVVRILEAVAGLH